MLETLSPHVETENIRSTKQQILRVP